jgi:hypothetical protein
MFINGNAPVELMAGVLEITNRSNVFPLGSVISMSPTWFHPPLASLPIYTLTSLPNNNFAISRANTPGVSVPDSDIIAIYPQSPLSDSIENTVEINGDVISENTITGLSGMRYVTGIKLVSSTDPPASVRYTGATMLIEPYGTGPGSLDVLLPNNFFTNPLYVGKTIFRFICDSTDSQTINLRDANGVIDHTVIANTNEIVECVLLPSGNTFITYPLTSITLPNPRG